MNMRDLSYIVAVDKYQAFGKAAQSCHVSQPTLSGQIKKLETELGITIFERNNKSVRTTQIGRQIIDIARDILDRAEQMKGVADAAQNAFTGKISLGIIPTIAPYIIPIFVEKMSGTFPHLSAAYQENLTGTLNKMLLGGELDAAILATKPEDDRLAYIPLYKEPFWLVCPQEHPIAGQENLQISDIPEDEVLLLTEGHCFRDQALAICRAPTQIRKQSIRATSLETLVNMVGARQGLTLLPALALGERISPSLGLVARRIEGLGASRMINLTYRRTYPRRQLLDAFAGLIRENLPMGPNGVRPYRINNR